MESQYHFPMELLVCVVHPTEDGLDVVCSSQWLQSVQETVALLLNIPQNTLVSTRTSFMLHIHCEITQMMLVVYQRTLSLVINSLLTLPIWPLKTHDGFWPHKQLDTIFLCHPSCFQQLLVFSCLFVLDPTSKVLLAPKVTFLLVSLPIQSVHF